MRKAKRPDLGLWPLVPPVQRVFCSTTPVSRSCHRANTQAVALAKSWRLQSSLLGSRHVNGSDALHLVQARAPVAGVRLERVLQAQVKRSASAPVSLSWTLRSRAQSTRCPTATGSQCHSLLVARITCVALRAWFPYSGLTVRQVFGVCGASEAAAEAAM